MPYEITQCYLPPDSGDFPAFIPTVAGTRFSDPGGMQGWVDLGGGYIPWQYTSTQVFICGPKAKQLDKTKKGLKRSVSDSHRNLLYSTAPEPLKGF